MPGSAAIELVIAGYSLAYGVLLVTGGRLGDMFGRKRVYLIGMAAFTAGVHSLRPRAECADAGGGPGAAGCHRLAGPAAGAGLDPRRLRRRRAAARLRPDGPGDGLCLRASGSWRAGC